MRPWFMDMRSKLYEFSMAKYHLGWELVNRIDEDLSKYGGLGLRICAIVGGSAGSLLPFFGDSSDFSVGGAFVGGVTGAIVGHLAGRAIAKYKHRFQNPERARYVSTYIELSDVPFDRPDDGLEL